MVTQWPTGALTVVISSLRLWPGNSAPVRVSKRALCTSTSTTTACAPPPQVGCTTKRWPVSIIISPCVTLPPRLLPCALPPLAVLVVVPTMVEVSPPVDDWLDVKPDTDCTHCTGTLCPKLMLALLPLRT